ncbi:MAG: chromosome partitioning protein ParA, partial [Flavobacteriaceae bacterium]|nr:chromosome partitioning protein ParA [Flavobacteriaceae bacterium]
AKTKFYYQNKTLDICEYISGDKFEKGTYVINLFEDEETISSSTFSLN